MLHFYTDQTVYRLPAVNEWWALEAYLDGAWTPVPPRERDLERMRPITEEQADELNALDPADRALPVAA